jgi:[acyl-carrier-protein] S-malonyltransferase
MAHDLFEDGENRELLSQAEERLHVPLLRLMREGPEAELQATENAQPAILLHSLALLQRLQSRGVAPDAIAGHSLGEFTGLVAAGALQPVDALSAVRARGQAMAAAAPSGTGMMAVLGLDDAIVDHVCAEVDGVVPANYNAPGQVVISGRDTALAAVTPMLQRAGARRVVRLPVSAAFHSPLMAEAAVQFSADWNKIPLQGLTVPQVFNADAQVHAEPDDIRPLMVGQLRGPVRWTQSVRKLQDLGVDNFVEIGPGRTLTGLVKKIAPGALLHNIDDLSSMNAFLETAHV